MEFGLSKCAVIHMKKGKISNSPCVKGIPELSGEDSYKYLGILQTDTILHDKVKESTRKEYLQRVRKILKANINAKYTTDAIKTYAMPVLRYGFGILKWTQGELRAIDTKTRKVLTKHGLHHPRSDIHRMYLSRSDGGRGLIGAADCHSQECSALAQHLENNSIDDPFISIVKRVESGKTYGLLSYPKAPKKRNVQDTNEYHLDSLLKMKLHGDYFTRIKALPNIDLELSQSWLNNTYFRFETESLICAAQEQALATKYMTTKIWQRGTDTKCRLCKCENETVHHIVSGCKMLAANQYTYRHNQVGKYIHWWILKHLGVKVTESWTTHVPQDTTIHGDVTIMWDKAIPTDKKVKCNRPDITIHDRKKRECYLVDVTIPVCTNILKKEAEKIIKYRDLEIEIQKCWNLKKLRQYRLQ